jgi:hypothetical protein
LRTLKPPLDIARQRLANQHLTTQSLDHPSDVVRRLGAVQSQDYAAAKWGVAQRTRGATDAVVEHALDHGAILRTHVLRPTWHFVAPEDIRWMLALTAPRVRALMAYYDRKLELTDAVFRRSHAALAKALEGGRHLTRTEIGRVFHRAKIDTTGLQRLGHLMMRAELDGVVCSGLRRGKQFTYALLEERVPAAKALSRDEALAELAMRYFATRGPATAQDFAWWSGLTVTDAKAGIHAIEAMLDYLRIDGKQYWSAADGQVAIAAAHSAHLLPNFDEYFIGFKDRSAIGAAVRANPVDDPSGAFGRHVIVVNGQLVGGWKRRLTRDSVAVELNVVTPVRAIERRAIAAAARRYGQFLGLPVEIQESVAG